MIRLLIKLLLYSLREKLLVLISIIIYIILFHASCVESIGFLLASKFSFHRRNNYLFFQGLETLGFVRYITTFFTAHIICIRSSTL